MPFNLNDHTTRQKILVHARLKWPDEKNINKLCEMGAKDLGLTLVKITSITATHLPTPEETARENPKSRFLLECPNCKKKSYLLKDLCRKCKESEGGKYKTMLKCFECGYETKSDKPLVIRLQEMGIDFGSISKKDLGIETITDNGVK
jgi:hypothetical protein